MITDDVLDLAVLRQMAGQGFSGQGRGFVLILANRAAVYFPAAQIDQLEREGKQTLPDLRRFIATYDPATQAVVALTEIQPSGWARMELAIVTLRGIGHAN